MEISAVWCIQESDLQLALPLTVGANHHPAYNDDVRMTITQRLFSRALRMMLQEDLLCGRYGTLVLYVQE
jgi:hypothetical protein